LSSQSAQVISTDSEIEAGIAVEAIAEVSASFNDIQCPGPEKEDPKTEMEPLKTEDSENAPPIESNKRGVIRGAFEELQELGARVAIVVEELRLLFENSAISKLEQEDSPDLLLPASEALASDMEQEKSSSEPELAIQVPLP
jgi:hypothetical protein